MELIVPDLVRYGLLCLIVLITNFQEGVTGFGCTALALPFAVMLVGLDVAKPVLVMLALVLNGSIVIMSWRKIVWKEYWYIILFVGIGLPIGMWMGEVLPEKGLKAVLAVFMTGVGIQGLVNLSRKVAQSELGKRTKLFVTSFLPLGGVIHGAFGSGGPLVIVYATRAIGDKGVFRVTLSLVWITLNLILVSSWILRSQITPHIQHLALLCLPFTIAGLIIGNFAHHRMNDYAFKKMVYVVLCFSGVLLLWSILK